MYVRNGLMKTKGENERSCRQEEWGSMMEKKQISKGTLI